MKRPPIDEATPASYVDSMPCDDTLLLELGRVMWAAARLHAGVRDAINGHTGSSSEAPFNETLGGALKSLRKLADAAQNTDQVSWVDDVAAPAKDLRDSVAHAVTYTADGVQAIGATRRHGHHRFDNDRLRDVSRQLIYAHSTLPR